jgi:Methyltransferase domain
MSGCCDPRGCNDIFKPGFARHLASRYRKRGLDKTAARMAAYVVDRGIDGASVLEIGGGVGALQLELLAKGASRTTNLELVDAYETDASELAKTAGMRDRMTRRQVDIAATPDEVDAHDIVVLHRVVCCYPDYERLLTAAADHAKRLLVFSHPRRNWVSRTAARLENATFRLRARHSGPSPILRRPWSLWRRDAACGPTTPTEVGSGTSSASREQPQPAEGRWAPPDRHQGKARSARIQANHRKEGPLGRHPRAALRARREPAYANRRSSAAQV